MQPRAILIVLLLALIATAGAAPLLRGRGQRDSTGPAAGAPADTPPQEAAYRAAMETALGGDLPSARSQFLTLATEWRGESRGAWALYQAALGARAQKDEQGFRTLAAELRRDYAGHRLTLAPGFREERAGAPSFKPRLPDCGPRSLLHLCAEAGIGTDRETVARLCATDRHGTTLEGLRKGAEALGMRAAPAQVDAAFLRRHRPAGIAWAAGDHFVAFLPGPSPGHFWIFDPNVGERRPATAGELMRTCNGVVLLTAWGERKLPPLRKDEG